MSYQALEKEFRSRSWTYSQIWRDDDAAVYEVRVGSGRAIGFEIIAIKKQSPVEMFGKNYPAKELYPTDEDWGALAWSWGDREQSIAQAKSVSARCAKGEFKGRFTGPKGSRAAPRPTRNATPHAS